MHCCNIAGLQEELKASQRDVAALQKALAEARVAQLAGEAVTLGNGAVLLAAAVDGLDVKSLQACSSWPVLSSACRTMHCSTAARSGRSECSLCGASCMLMLQDAAA